MFASWLSPVWILRFAIVLASLVVHEFAHAAMATWLGDSTPRRQGRLTLNPAAHLELTGLIAMLVAPIGWARPVEIHPGAFRHPRAGMAWVALAGPLANAILAALSFGIQNIPFVSTSDALQQVFGLAFEVNVALVLLNILPIPPLDGWRALSALLPVRWRLSIAWLDAYGPWLLLLIFLLPPTNRAFSDLVYAVMSYCYGA
ncbi:site-2 protease family protein [Alicyclobacillus sendaiensis]|uniref:Site-2 protease family protein n=1 Tax=Alicyclobacillus sendaiensis PA2 TaxID=3029425 RepID=A0ABT6Y0W0_ALISE|nr:site-2 protease family protein [Alicyclobacillus sendaiensis]MDI9260979.1 site-2 protease family protein [Alicyclobacillus sendaiensis PA2]